MLSLLIEETMICIHNGQRFFFLDNAVEKSCRLSPKRVSRQQQCQMMHVRGLNDGREQEILAPWSLRLFENNKTRYFRGLMLWQLCARWWDWVINSPTPHLFIQPLMHSAERFTNKHLYNFFFYFTFIFLFHLCSH